jgi:hypothetical protein
LALAAPQVAEPDSVVSGNSPEKLMVELAAANAEKEWKQAAQEFQKDWDQAKQKAQQVGDAENCRSGI